MCPAQMGLRDMVKQLLEQCFAIVVWQTQNGPCERRRYVQRFTTGLRMTNDNRVINNLHRIIWFVRVPMCCAKSIQSSFGLFIQALVARVTATPTRLAARRGNFKGVQGR